MSEIFQRFVLPYIENHNLQSSFEFKKKLHKMLGSPEDVCIHNCDSYYFDFSEIDWGTTKKMSICRDAYLVYGINNKLEFIKKIVDRYDFDKAMEL